AKKLNQERLDATNKVKAEAFLARKSADEERGWYLFLQSHAGQWALSNGAYLSCVANDRLLTEWLAAHQLPVTEENLQEAYSANKNRLAQLPIQQYERVTNTLESRVFPQIKSLQP